jgi:hypothetical protein
LSRTPLALAGALLAVPVALGVLPTAAAAPTNPKAAKGAEASAAAFGDTTEEPSSGSDARVVVAVIDDGINPYHEAYYAGGGPYSDGSAPSSVTPEVLAEFGIGPDQVVELTRTGDFASDFAADSAVWEAIEPGTPYWFKGTNVIGISFDGSGTPIYSDPGDTHGTGTSSAVLNANPEAVVVMVEGISAESETWAFTHPAVDIVSTSYGFPGSLPLPFHLEKSFEGVVGLGKLHYGASDNSPALSPPDGTSGPWWSIGVAGFHEDTSGGRETLSGNVIDVVSDFTQDLPYCSDCQTGTRSVSGTSFATPRSAGTASTVLLEARRAAGHTGGIVTADGAAPLMVDGDAPLTNWQLRRAFEEAAAYPGLADYDPVEAAFDFGATPVVDAAPYVQTGWGVFSPDERYGVVDEALAQLGITGEPRPAKSADACAFNTAQFELRKAYWDNVAIGSESFLTDEDPYLRC